MILCVFLTFSTVNAADLNDSSLNSVVNDSQSESSFTNLNEDISNNIVKISEDEDCVDSVNELSNLNDDLNNDDLDSIEDIPSIQDNGFSIHPVADLAGLGQDVGLPGLEVGFGDLAVLVGDEAVLPLAPYGDLHEGVLLPRLERRGGDGIRAGDQAFADPEIEHHILPGIEERQISAARALEAYGLGGLSGRTHIGHDQLKPARMPLGNDFGDRIDGLRLRGGVLERL